MRKLHGFTIIFVLAFLTACGTTNAPGAVTGPPAPKPLTVSAVQESGNTVSAVIPVTGGTLEAMGADGATYRLTVPAGALLATTTVSMTPLVSLAGAPVTGSLHGVALEPAGLRLYDAATLEITPVSGGALSAIGFAANSDGSQFHLVPPSLTGSADSVTLGLFHFSLHGSYVGTEVAPYTIEGSLDDFMPTDWEAQLEQLLSNLLAKERAAEFMGEEGDPELAEKLEAILNTIFQRSIAPLLPAIGGSCAGVEAHGSKALAWVRSTQLVGMGATFASEAALVQDATRAGAHRCWEEAIQPCIDPAAAGYARVLQAARLNLLLGGSSAVYDPAREELQCENECAWVADVTAVQLDFRFDYSLSGNVLGESGSIGKLSRSWTASAYLHRVPDDAHSHVRTLFQAHLQDGDDLNVSYSVDSTITHEGELLVSTRGSGSVPTGDSYLLVALSTLSCVMSGTFSLHAPDMVTQRYAPPRIEERDLMVGWVVLSRQPLTPGVTQGAAMAQANNTDSQAVFNAGIEPVLSAFRNAGNWGAAEVEWTMTMITEPTEP